MVEVVRLAILDHDTHKLYVEDVLRSEIEEEGDEEAYIKANYQLGNNWSWEYIVSGEYFALEDKTPIEITFDL